jgi:peptidoglycan/LPS O-acetylase OafA/YrhL
MASRNRTLDGLRGCLALLVMAHHAVYSTGYPYLLLPAGIAVWLFFIISGYVLTAAWDGRYLPFLLRRAVRLWPVYALCLIGAAAAFGAPVPLLQYVWLPIENALSGPAANPPAWSLTIEAWAMLLMPAYVWTSKRSILWLLVAISCTVLASAALANVLPSLFCAVFFFIGSWLSRYELRWSLLERPVPQWLGRISYPLYLCHWPIIINLHLPLWASIPLSFAAAEALTRTVERWSINWSRRVSRVHEKDHPALWTALQASAPWGRSAG